MKVRAINTIHRRPDPRKPIEVVKPGQIFDATESELEDLSKLDAIRPATKGEVAEATDAVDTAAGAKTAASGSAGARGGRKPRGGKSRPTDGDDLV